MTSDGQAAVFRLSRSLTEGPDDAGTETVTTDWVGPGTHPAVDFRCHQRGCSDAQAKKLAEAMQAAGLVTCREVGSELSFGGHGATLETDGALWLEVDGRWQWLRAWAGGHDGNDHESFETAYQVADGPVYVLIGNADTGLQETRLAVYTPADLGLCERGVVPADPATPAVPTLTPTLVEPPRSP